MSKNDYKMKQRWEDQLPEIFNFCYKLTFDWPLSRKLSHITALHAGKILSDRQSGIDRKLQLFKIATTHIRMHFQEPADISEKVNHEQTNNFYLYRKIMTLTKKYRCEPEEILVNLEERYFYRALHNLPIAFALIIMLKDIEAFSSLEIADIMDIDEEQADTLITCAAIAYQKQLWHQISLQLKNNRFKEYLKGISDRRSKAFNDYKKMR